MKPKRKKKRKTSKTKMILSISAVVLIILAAATVYLSQPSSVEKKNAQEYFQILGSTVDDGSFPNWPDTTVLLIKALSFNITAVGGNATGVVIDSVALSDPQPIGDISKGQIAFISLQFRGGYLTTIKDQGYPVKIRIRSLEAEGELTVYIQSE